MTYLFLFGDPDLDLDRDLDADLDFDLDGDLVRCLERDGGGGLLLIY